MGNLKNILFINQMILLVILLNIMMMGKNLPMYSILFWTFFTLFVIDSFLVILKCDKTIRTLSIILLDIFIFSIFAFQYPYFYQGDIDTTFEAQTADIILQEKMWNPTGGKGLSENYYGYNPGIHFFMSFISAITGMSSIALSKYLVIYIFRILFILLVYLIIDNIINTEYDRLNSLALFLYVISPRLRVVYVSRRFFALLFILFALYCFIKEKNTKKVIWEILFYVFSFLVIIGDHFHSYLFLAFLIYLAIFYAIFRRDKFANMFKFRKNDPFFYSLIRKIIVYFIMLVTWLFWFAKPLVANDWYYLKFYSKKAFTIDLISSVSKGTPGVSLYTPIHKFFIYGSQLIILFLSILGFIFILRRYHIEYKELVLKYKKYIRERQFLLFWYIFGMALFMFNLVLVNSEINVASNVSFWIALIPLSILSAYTLLTVKAFHMKTLFSKIVTISIILIIYIGGLLINYHPSVFNPESSQRVDFSEYKNEQIYQAGKWISETNDGNITVLGDVATYDLFSGIFFIDSVDPWLSKEIMSDEMLLDYFLDNPVKIGSSLVNTTRRNRLDYVVFNLDTSTSTIDANGTFIETNRTEIWDLNSNTRLNKVYDNQRIWLFYNR